MTLDDAIMALTKHRETLGGDAPLRMADCLEVVSLDEVNGVVYVFDVPQPPRRDDDPTHATAGVRG